MIFWRFDKDVRGFVIGNEFTGFSLTVSWKPTVQYSFFLYGMLWIIGWDNVDGFVFGSEDQCIDLRWILGRFTCDHREWRRDRTWENFAGTSRLAWRCCACPKLEYRSEKDPPDVVIIG